MYTDLLQEAFSIWTNSQTVQLWWIFVLSASFRYKKKVKSLKLFWGRCAIAATTMTIWQIKPSAHNVLLQLCSSCAKCMSSNEATDVITGRLHCFHDWIYIMPVMLLCDLSNVCRGSLTTTYVIWTYIGRCLSK